MSETNDGFTVSHLLGAYFKAFPNYEWSDPETDIDLMLAAITTLRTALATATERATKAEAALGQARRIATVNKENAFTVLKFLDTSTDECGALEKERDALRTRLSQSHAALKVCELFIESE